MLLDGLPDVSCSIKLWACNSGVVMPGFGQSYARRFAEALGKRAFRKPKIYGYIGFAMGGIFTKKDEEDVRGYRDGKQKVVARQLTFQRGGSLQLAELHRAKDSKVIFSLSKSGVSGLDKQEGVHTVSWDGNGPQIEEWKIVPIF